MKILLTNDDGIHAEGLLALVKYLEKKHEVYFAHVEEGLEITFKQNGSVYEKGLKGLSSL